MFIQKVVNEHFIARNYTDALIEEYIDNNPNSFENNYIELSITPNRLQYLARNWKCPKNAENRKVLSEPDWERERSTLLAYGQSLKINKRAELCGTFHKFGTSYLIWLEFTGSDNVKHKIDIFLSKSSSKGELYAEKIIDGVECADIYNCIINDKNIEVVIAKKLNSIGSVTWSGTAEEKVQYKLNSWKQQTIFEDAASECPFVKLEQLDPFDNYLYKGDPGKLADYDLTLTCSDGMQVSARIDLKLLRSRLTLQDQVAHDAELLVASILCSDEIVRERRDKFDCATKIEETVEFKKFMLVFKQKLKNAGNCFIKINRIDTNTGKIDYEFFT